MLNWVARYQVFITLFLIGSGFLFIGLRMERSPSVVMAPPAYAAAGDVYGSPNVTVAAFRARIPLGSGSAPILLLVKADGTLATTALPATVRNFLDDDADAQYTPGGVTVGIGSDRRAYILGFSGWQPGSSSSPLP